MVWVGEVDACGWAEWRPRLLLLDAPGRCVRQQLAQPLDAHGVGGGVEVAKARLSFSRQGRLLCHLNKNFLFNRNLQIDLCLI